MWPNGMVMLVYFNIITYENQSIYGANYFCESVLNLLISDWQEVIENFQVVILVFLDLNAAFETVRKEIMVTKLPNIGIVGNELQCLISYMDNRQQF